MIFGYCDLYSQMFPYAKLKLKEQYLFINSFKQN